MELCAIDTRQDIHISLEYRTFTSTSIASGQIN